MFSTNIKQINNTIFGLNDKNSVIVQFNNISSNRIKEFKRYSKKKKEYMSKINDIPCTYPEYIFDDLFLNTNIRVGLMLSDTLIHWV
jgi:hypothetical protein